MIKVLKSIGILIFVYCFFGCELNGTNNIPTTYFFSESNMHAYHISPDGNFVSYILTQNNVNNIFIYNLSTGSKTQITALKHGHIKSYFWANNNTIFYIKENHTSQSICYVNTNGKGNYQTLNANNITFIDNKIWHNKFILIAMKQNGFEHAFKVNISTWKPEIEAHNNGYINQWLPDNKGNIKLAIAKNNILYRPNNNAPFKLIITSNPINTINPLKFCQNNSSFFALSNVGRDKITLVTINCSKGQETSIINKNTNADVINVEFKNSLPYYLTVEKEKKTHLFLNNNVKKLFDTIATCLKTYNFEIVDKDTKNQNFLIKTYNDRQKDAYYFYNISQDKATKISANETFNPSDLCETKAIQFKNRNKAIIYGYLTLPKKNKQNSPCVIIPSPNPSKRATWGFAPEAQFLANRGYAVLQLNYRGIWGYGKTYKATGKQSWIISMQSDITTAAQWVINNKIADKNKLAIFGYEFGGFAALSIAGAKPQLFKCAASYSGINNFFTYFKDNYNYNNAHQQTLFNAIRQSNDDVLFMHNISPIFNTDKINIPVYIVQGGKDKRISVNETNQFVKTLRKRNVKIKYLIKENENHRFNKNENIIELYNHLETFLNQNLN